MAKPTVPSLKRDLKREGPELARRTVVHRRSGHDHTVAIPATGLRGRNGREIRGQTLEGPAGCSKDHIVVRRGVL